MATQISDTNLITIIQEPGALVFATRKEWKKLPECCLCELEQQETECVFMGSNSVFFLFCDNGPLSERLREYQLVKITMDEDGKQTFYTMELSSAQAEQLKESRFSMWG